VDSLESFFVEYASSTQSLLFVSIMGGFWLVENFISAQSIAQKWQHSSVNLLFIISALPIQLPASLLLAMVTAWAADHHWGLVYLLPNYSSPWIKYGLMFVVLDFLDWLYHFLMHKIPAFWRFHLVHHTDLSLDVSSTVREHPGETVFRNGFLVFWVLVCGASFEVLLLSQALETIANISSHTSFRLKPRAARVLGWLFITPNLHHVHHHFERPYTDSNYGDIFSIWDRLFGTFAELSAEETVFGLDTHMDPAVNGSYLATVAVPFPKFAERLARHRAAESEVSEEYGPAVLAEA
jgi:sterol desaturase/sphingolipid hydroxylase (fatty acid hydroxylase superfamily)